MKDLMFWGDVLCLFADFSYDILHYVFSSDGQ